MDRHCKYCKRKLHKEEGLEDETCGDCGLAMMFGAMPNVICVKKESGEPLTQEMIDQAQKGTNP